MTDCDADLFNKILAANLWLNRALRFYRAKMELMPFEGNRALAEASLAAGDALRMLEENREAETH